MEQRLLAAVTERNESLTLLEASEKERGRWRAQASTTPLRTPRDLLPFSFFRGVYRAQNARVASRTIFHRWH